MFQRLKRNIKGFVEVHSTLSRFKCANSTSINIIVLASFKIDLLTSRPLKVSDYDVNSSISCDLSRQLKSPKGIAKREGHKYALKHLTDDVLLGYSFKKSLVYRG